MKTMPFEGVLSPEQLLNIQEWIQELRSGQYKQAIGYLKRLDKQNCLTSYCCLGVLCEHANIPSQRNEYSEYSFLFSEETVSATPNIQWMIERVGFDFSKRVLLDEEDPRSFSLAELNDVKKLNFSTIADVIQACFIDRIEIEIL